MGVSDFLWVTGRPFMDQLYFASAGRCSERGQRALVISTLFCPHAWVGGGVGPA